MINKKLKILVLASPFCEHDLKPINILKKNNIHYDLNPKGRKLTENEITNIIEKYDGLIADVETLNMKVLSKAKNLKIISRVGIGVNNIDLKFAKKKKIIISNTPDAPTPAVVELNLSLIFALIRNVVIHSTELKKGNWERLLGLRLPFLTIGILGLGRVGSSLAKKLLKIGCKKILYNDLNKKKTNSRTIFKSKDYIFKNCDLICLTLPETLKTKNFLNKKIFKQMKKTSFIINTSRGELINEKDLLNFLKKGYFSGIALDVFNNEPYKGEFRKFNRCILTPHIGSHTIDCRNKMELEATKNIENFFKSKPIINKVN